MQRGVLLKNVAINNNKNGNNNLEEVFQKSIRIENNLF